MKALRAGDVMQTNVVTTNGDVSVTDAALTMLRHKISGLPVIGWDRRLIGIVTEGDLLRRAEIGTERHRAAWLELLRGPGRAAEEYTAAHARKISEVMSDREVVAVKPDTPLSEVVELIEKHKIKRVPVVTDDGRVLGIVSRADFLRALVDAAPADVATPGSDAQIRDQILTAIDREKWSPRATINVMVTDGTVELNGCIIDDRERAAMIVLAENVPGVKKVVDHLVWVEPMSGMVMVPPSSEEPVNVPPVRMTRF